MVTIHNQRSDLLRERGQWKHKAIRRRKGLLALEIFIGELNSQNSELREDKKQLKLENKNLKEEIDLKEDKISELDERISVLEANSDLDDYDDEPEDRFDLGYPNWR